MHRCRCNMAGSNCKKKITCVSNVLFFVGFCIVVAFGDGEECQWFQGFCAVDNEDKMTRRSTKESIHRGANSSTAGKSEEKKKKLLFFSFVNSFINAARSPKAFAVKTVVVAKINPFKIHAWIGSDELCFDLKRRKKSHCF